MRKLTLTDTK